MTGDAERPRLTEDLPGCGGLFKAVPEDFEVEELPAYDPSGEGSHLYFWIEKRGRETPEIARALAKAAGVDEREVGYAGLKDRQGITRQLFSVPAGSPSAPVDAWVAAAEALEGVKVLWTRRHGNKLRTGHLRGNRFIVRLRGVSHPEHVAPKLERLERVGLPNYFGAQRFGRGDDNAALGRRLLKGERLERAPSAFQRRLYLSAFQSLLFNRALSERVREGTLDRALMGDVMEKTESGGLFVCAAPEVDAPRVTAWEISPAGPMFGPKMRAAEGEVAQREARLLEEAGVTLGDFRRGKGETEGARRAYRVKPGELSWSSEEDVLTLRFTLPKGSYATVLLDELMEPVRR